MPRPVTAEIKRSGVRVPGSPPPVALVAGRGSGGGGDGRNTGHVGLGADHEPGSVEELGPIAAQLVEQHPALFLGGDTGHRFELEQHQQDPGPGDVAQEAMPQALAVGRPFHQPGDVGHGEVDVVRGAHHTQVGLQGGEGVVGDLGLGRRDARDQGALAHVGETDQGHVGHQGQLHVVPLLMAGFALFGESRGSAPVAQERGVAPTPPPAFRRHPAVARSHQVGENGPVAVGDLGAHGDEHLEVGALGAVLLLPPP